MKQSIFVSDIDFFRSEAVTFLNFFFGREVGNFLDFFATKQRFFGREAGLFFKTLSPRSGGYFRFF